VVEQIKKHNEKRWSNRLEEFKFEEQKQKKIDQITRNWLISNKMNWENKNSKTI
jgi:hypothetical protein